MVGIFFLSLGLLLAGKAGEGSAEGEFSVDVLGRKSLKLFLVGVHLADEVHEVLRLLKSIQVLSINHEAEFVLNLDNELDHIK